ncbi:MAG: ABC transporter permease [Oceanicaulis sp.]|uniref:ABC transporter permease n=1 Tax=Glycocaulis sp. TaxID=1969725 RepID=UPI0025BA0589|nr:ABC transporter permease [Glycocaulis sp.]MCC5981547.1 ABC transporter permease [Oceanicaulis sp.]MCH8522756.1 ABC transporter permease [Glycocaulis sp.]
MSFAWSDMAAAFPRLRIWAYLAFKQIQFEHRRSVLGSAWIVLSYAITAAGIGFLMSQLQGRPVEVHVPHVMFGLAIWNFISGATIAGADIMVTSRSYLLQMNLPRSLFVLSMLLRLSYLLGIQLVTAFVICLFFGWRPTLEIVWIFPAFAVYLAAGFGTALTLGMVAARFRDISTLVGSCMRLIFFFTPIIWAVGTARDQAEGFIGFLVRWNPFSYVLNTLRDGLVGLPPDPLNWTVTLAITALVLFTGILALDRMGRRVTYWL